MMKPIFFIALFLSISSCSSLKVEEIESLDWSNKNLKDLKGTNILEYKNLKELFLTNNRFETFPKELLRLEKLQKLYLGRNLIDSVPVDIDKLQQLKFLSLSENPIRFIPKSIVNVKELNTVLLRGYFTEEQRKEFRSSFSTKTTIIFYSDLPSVKGTNLNEGNHQNY